MASLDALPAALEPLRVYLARAAEFQRADSKVSHLVRVFAMKIGLALRPRLKPSDSQFLLVLMDELESERLSLPTKSAAEEQAALRAFAVGLYNRAKANDKPEVMHPHPSMKWTVVEAPRVAACFHAAAVAMDALKQYERLPGDLQACQDAAHRRSLLLSQQLAKALQAAPCVPQDWRPLPYAMLQPPATPAPAAPPALRRPRRRWRPRKSTEHGSL